MEYDDQDAASLYWKKYRAAIKKYKLDNTEGYTVLDYMYDSFFCGFFTGRDYEKEKKESGLIEVPK